MSYKNKLPVLSIYFILLLMLSSCDLINPTEPIPRRILLNPVTLEVQAGQGSARHKITELWTFADSNYLGAFSPPVVVNYHTDEPVTNLILRAGIRNNGILDAAIVYPMYTQYE